MITKLLRKTSLLLILLLLGGFALKGQNLQLHYDFGKALYPKLLSTRPALTLTVEQQSVDKFGDTFYFVDMNLQGGGGVGAMWKFFRNLRFWQGPLSWHIRYDGGLLTRPTDKGRIAIPMQDAFFTGATYTYLRPDRKLVLSFTPSYKYIRGHHKPHNWELVAVWKYAPGNGLFSATGFFTFWQEERIWQGDKTTSRFKMMSQPQFWLNLNKVKGFSPHLNLSLGTELRFSHNIEAKQLIFAPTLALKWSFTK